MRNTINLTSWQDGKVDERGPGKIPKVLIYAHGEEGVSKGRVQDLNFDHISLKCEPSKWIPKGS